MRLAQLARKVKITPNEIKNFLENQFEENIGNDPNLKLDEKHIESVLAHYQVEEEESNPIESEMEKAKTPSKDTETEEGLEIETNNIIQTPSDSPIPNEEDSEEEEEEVQKSADIKEDEPVVEATENEIEEDNFAEDQLDPFTEREVDPNAELVKSPKVVLDGLKVLGKIDLPESENDVKKLVDEAKSDQETETDTSDDIGDLEASMESMVQDIKPVSTQKKTEINQGKTNDSEDEDNLYKNDKGIYRFTAEQRENRKKKIVLIEEKKRLQALKEKKKRHYETQHKVKKSSKSNIKKSQPSPVSKQASKSIKKTGIKKNVEEKPTTLWGRIMNWLND